MPFGSLLRGKTQPGERIRAFRKRQHPRVSFSGPATLCWIAPDGWPKAVQANLVNASEGGMAVQMRRPLPGGTRVWILLDDGADGRGEVGYCDQAQQGYQVGLRFIAEERDPEFEFQRPPNLVEWIGECGRLLGSPAVIRNAAEGEVEVLVSRVVPCPAIVLLSGPHVRCLCSTCDCRPEGNSYRIRMAVMSETRPNSTTA